MSKVTDKCFGCEILHLDCGHFSEQDAIYGDEVDCPICADNEKQVKAARVEVLEEVSDIMSLCILKRYDIFQACTRINKLKEASQ
ncbi:hypothetical protein LCGC14_2514780 [marine sediment metagenome]|uniref:Uncharacterized protein n=1 Tax=marine sediment metagenome TaxID=412755 RepID=A0A0F9DRE9_9ZZZZ